MNAGGMVSENTLSKAEQISAADEIGLTARPSNGENIYVVIVLTESAFPKYSPSLRYLISVHWRKSWMNIIPD